VIGCRLRAVHAKRTGRRDALAGTEDSPSLGTPSSAAALKRKRKVGGGDSDEDDEDDEDSDDPVLDPDDDEEEEEEIKKAKKIEIICDEVNLYCYSIRLIYCTCIILLFLFTYFSTISYQKIISIYYYIVFILMLVFFSNLWHKNFLRDE